MDNNVPKPSDMDNKDDASDSPGHFQQLPNELFPCITKFLRDEDCVALALSGALKGFAAFYRLNRKHVISNKCSFLTPSVWNTYFNQHIIPARVTNFNVNHLYWLPPGLLGDAIIQMKSLEALGIRDTKVSLPIMDKILKACPEIRKLDFSFIFESLWKEMKESVESKNTVILDSMKYNFQKLTCLKISTSVMDARDYLHDPWQVLFLFFGMCRDCVDLSVEITYTGEDYEYPDYYPTDIFEDAQQLCRREIYPHLSWMSSLKSLVLVKFGDFQTADELIGLVRSLMLDNLLSWLFNEEPAPSSLQHLWVQDFCFKPGYQTIRASAPSLISYQIEDSGEIIMEDQPFSSFPNLEALAKMEFFENCPLLYLPNLKYAHGSCFYNNEPMVNDFVRTHPNLECLAVQYYGVDNVPNQLWKLPKLRVLDYSRESINKEIVESLMNVYPNVEILHLWNKNNENKISSDRDCLSSIHFPNLTFLSLKNFKFNDGAFLLPIIKKCPKLQHLDLSYAGFLELNIFASNLDLFLPLAEKLKDFRLECEFKGNGSLILPLLKSFLKHCPQLERLVLLDTAYDDSFGDWNHPSEMIDAIVRFASEMPRLVAFCIAFFHLHPDVAEEVNRRIAEEVLPLKSPLYGSA